MLSCVKFLQCCQRNSTTIMLVAKCYPNNTINVLPCIEEGYHNVKVLQISHVPRSTDTTSAPIGAQKFNSPPYQDIMTDRPTKRPTIDRHDGSQGSYTLNKQRGRKRERERERETGRERHRERERETDRETQREREKKQKMEENRKKKDRNRERERKIS